MICPLCNEEHENQIRYLVYAYDVRNADEILEVLDDDHKSIWTNASVDQFTIAELPTKRRKGSILYCETYKKYIPVNCSVVETEPEDVDMSDGPIVF